MQSKGKAQLLMLHSETHSTVECREDAAILKSEMDSFMYIGAINVITTLRYIFNIVHPIIKK